MTRITRSAVLCVFLYLIFTSVLWAKPRIEKNVVYGMYSGLALLMDVYYPQESNGRGIVFIWGSGWHAPLSFAAPQLKGRGPFPLLTESGYTVFVVNHRAAPRFRYPAAVEDVQRAVRFIRHNAAKYEIDDSLLGGIGGSSGAHLVSMLGTLDDSGDANDPDPINQHSSKLQCVVAFATPSDLAVLESEGGSSAVASFVGMPPPRYRVDKTSEEYRTYWEASPANHVSVDDPPFLLVHGDADDVVPFEQAELFEQALSKAGVEVRLVRVPRGSHGVLPEILRAGWLTCADGRFAIAEVVDWFDRHLFSP